MTVQQQQEQRREALAKANAVRLEKARLKRDLLAGNADAARLLLDPPPIIQKVRVGDFLTWLPTVGPRRAAVLVRGILPASTIEIRRLSPATREQLAARVRERTDRCRTCAR